MALYTVPLPSVDGGDEDISRQMRKIIGYLRQLDEQLKYVLCNLDGENLSDSFRAVIDSSTDAAVLDEVAGRLREGAVVVSLADGVPLAELEERLPEGVGAARALPSLTAQAGEGLTLLTPGASCSAAQADAAAGLFERSGDVVRVAEEQHAVLGPLSSGGPAFVLYLAEAMVEAGAVRGVPRDLARALVTQVLTGSAAWLRADGREVATLREKVCAPGGAGIRRIAALDRHGVRAAVVSALGDAPPGLSPR